MTCEKHGNAIMIRLWYSLILGVAVCLGLTDRVCGLLPSRLPPRHWTLPLNSLPKTSPAKMTQRWGAIKKMTLRATHSPPLIPAGDHWSIWGVLSVAAAVGAKIGDTQFGTFLSPPVCSMAITFFLSNVGVLPSGATPAVVTAQRLCVRLATPLLLYAADMRRVAAASGKLFPAFLLGTVATTVGAIIGKAAVLGGLCANNSDGAKLAAALCAKNIGGGLNYVAVCETLQVNPIAAAAGLTVDNIMALLYFPLCDYLGRRAEDPELVGVNDNDIGDHSIGVVSSASNDEDAKVSELSAALAIAVTIVAVAEKFCPSYSVVAATLLTVGLASAVPHLLGPLSNAGTNIGTVFLYIFFATAGASGGSLGATLVGIGPPLLLYLTILYAVHLTLLLSVGGRMSVWMPMLPPGRKCHKGGTTQKTSPLGCVKVGMGLPRATLLTASNANIGGPATACALAVGHKWKSLITPALVVGNFGYVIANFVALALFVTWTRHP